MMRSVMMSEFIRNIEQKPILDVREMDEYKEGHIAHALSRPLSVIENWALKLDKKTEYYVICYSGSRSMNACTYLSRLGYKVVNVMGGMSRYNGRLEDGM